MILFILVYSNKVNSLEGRGLKVKFGFGIVAY